MTRRYRSGDEHARGAVSVSGITKSSVFAVGILVVLSACAGLPVSMPGSSSPPQGAYVLQATGERPGEPDPTSDPKVTPSDQDPLPLDITGDAGYSEERDRLSEVLMPLVAYDGDRLWDPASKVLTIQMTSDAAIKQAQAMLRDDGTTMHVNFVRVQYTAKELDDLANHLLRNQLQWAGATGIGGGYDSSLNRVLLQVDPEYKDAPTLIDAIEKLDDPRVSLQLIRAMEGWQPEG